MFSLKGNKTKQYKIRFKKKKEKKKKKMKKQLEGDRIDGKTIVEGNTLALP